MVPKISKALEKKPQRSASQQPVPPPRTMFHDESLLKKHGSREGSAQKFSSGFGSLITQPKKHSLPAQQQKSKDVFAYYY